MRFSILKPHTAVDPRYTKFASVGELNAMLLYPGDAKEVPPNPSLHVECANEAEAVEAVRQLYGDAVGMPFKVVLGSGSAWLLGFVEDCSPINADSKLPFVLFVHAIAEDVGDRQVMSKRSPFNREAWKVPVIDPSDTNEKTRNPDMRGPYIVSEVEVRSPGVEIPQRVKLTSFGLERYHPEGSVASKTTHLVLYMEIGGVPMSIEFAAHDVRLLHSSLSVPGWSPPG